MYSRGGGGGGGGWIERGQWCEMIDFAWKILNFFLENWKISEAIAENCGKKWVNKPKVLNKYSSPNLYL